MDKRPSKSSRSIGRPPGLEPPSAEGSLGHSNVKKSRQGEVSCTQGTSRVSTHDRRQPSERRKRDYDLVGLQNMQEPSGRDQPPDVEDDTLCCSSLCRDPRSKQELESSSPPGLETRVSGTSTLAQNLRQAVGTPKKRRVFCSRHG